MSRKKAAAPLVQKTVSQKVVAELLRQGIDASECRTVYTLWKKLQSLEHGEAPLAPSMAAQALFLERWLAECERSRAQPRVVPPFAPYVVPRAMLEQLDRCRLHSHCRSSSSDGFLA